MNELLLFLTAGLQITLLDIVLSGDNVGLIALAIRNLPKEQAKMASLVGVAGAIGFRILFASIFTTLITIQWLPLKLIGGLLLLKITWDLLKTAPQESQQNVLTDEVPPQEQEKGLLSSPAPAEPNTNIDLVPPKSLAHPGFWKAVSTIILADLSMSLDNVLAVGGAANGNVGLIAFGITLNLPLLFFGSQYVADLMNKYRLIIYIGAGVLIHTALAMILEEHLLTPYIPHLVAVVVPWVIALCVLVHGYFSTRKKPEPKVKHQQNQQTEQIQVFHR